MPLPPLYGHAELKERVTTALHAGTLPTALLLVGAHGVGKQRLGLWIAAGIVCEKGPGAPCGECHACRMALALGHPDVHWFFPIARPKGDETKQVEEAEESLQTQIAARRENAVYARPDGMTGLFLPLIRALHRRVQMRPAMARARVFVVAEAERLVPQVSSPEAGNAMLKVLEEPPPDTYFILTTSEPAALLPTIKSRLVPLRVGRLKPADIVAYLTEVAQVAAPEAKRRADLAGGSIGAALEMSGGTDDNATRAKQLLAAAATPVSRYTYALGLRPNLARGEFTETLDAALELLRDTLARRLRDADAAAADDAPATRIAAQLREIEQARKMAQGNVNPQLITADLLRRLAEAGR